MLRQKPVGVTTLLIILTLRKDKSFAYDLFDQAGRVNGRVVLLLRSIERKPEPDLICEKHSPIVWLTWLVGIQRDCKQAYDNVGLWGMKKVVNYTAGGDWFYLKQLYLVE